MPGRLVLGKTGLLAIGINCPPARTLRVYRGS